MFSLVDHFSPRLAPYRALVDMVYRRRGIDQNNLDLRAMPEGLQRDLGIYDGRGRRGEPDWGEQDPRLSGQGAGKGRSGEDEFFIAKLGSSMRSF